MTLSPVTNMLVETERMQRSAVEDAEAECYSNIRDMAFSHMQMTMQRMACKHNAKPGFFKTYVAPAAIGIAGAALTQVVQYQVAKHFAPPVPQGITPEDLQTAVQTAVTSLQEVARQTPAPAPIVLTVPSPQLHDPWGDAFKDAERRRKNYQDEEIKRLIWKGVPRDEAVRQVRGDCSIQ